jgi:hypothetical protein
MDTNENTPSFVVQLHWKAIKLCDGRRFDWHKKRARAARDREQLEGPRVYRWVLRGTDGLPEQFYIGQAGNFEQRLPKYRSRKLAVDSTEALVQNEIFRCEEHNGTVDLEFLELRTPFRINGKLINDFSLGEPDVRIMMEHIAIVTARAEGLKLINRLSDNAYYVKIFSLVERIVGQKGKQEAMRSIRNILESAVNKDERTQQ